MIKEIDGKRFWENAQGGFVPEDAIKPVDQLRNQMVISIVNRVIEEQDRLIALKQAAMEDIRSFVQISNEKYGAGRRSVKGNLSFTSFDGEWRVSLTIAESFGFNERIEAARELIYDCLNDWSNGANSNLLAVVDSAFRLTNGRLDVKAILALKRINVSDDTGRWQKAMEAIDDALEVKASKPCLRIYNRNPQGRYELVPMDFTDIG